MVSVAVADRGDSGITGSLAIGCHLKLEIDLSFVASEGSSGSSSPVGASVELETMGILRTIHDLSFVFFSMHNSACHLDSTSTH